MHTSAASFLRTLCTLRWVATAGQVVTILMATHAMGLALPQGPLWAGVCTLALFNLYAQRRISHTHVTSPNIEFGHILVDVAVLTWMVGWSGGIGNPFGSLFLVLIALAALALPFTLGHGSRGHSRQWLLSQRRIRPATTTQPLQPSSPCICGDGGELSALNGDGPGIHHVAGTGTTRPRT